MCSAVSGKQNTQGASRSIGRATPRPGSSGPDKATGKERTMNDASKSRISRRSLLTGLATMPTLFVAAGSRAAQTKPDGAAVQEVQAALKKATGTKLVILGSGGGPSPMVPGRTRHNTSHVMVSNASAYVLDCGLGVTNQFARTGVSFTNVRSIFITQSPPRPQHRVRSLAPDRLGAGLAWFGARVRPAAAAADDRGSSPCLQDDNRFLGGRFQDEAARIACCQGSVSTGKHSAG